MTTICLSFVLFIVVIVLSVLRPFYCGHGIVCPSSFSLWWWYCLSFVLFIVVIALSVLRPFYWQCNDHNEKDEGQTIPWPQLKGRRTDNTMTTIKRTKDRQLSFVLFNVVMVLSVLHPFYCGHCIVCPSSFLLWSLYCLSFVLFIVVIALSVLRPIYCGNKKDEGQTIPWPH
jgi:magnesium-transporting ATPase (P-type)